MKIGYMRVSVEDQHLDRQTKALSCVGAGRIFEEKASVKNTDRSQLKGMLEYVRGGDILYIESISQLSRDLRDLLDIVDNIE